MFLAGIWKFEKGKIVDGDILKGCPLVEYWGNQFRLSVCVKIKVRLIICRLEIDCDKIISYKTGGGFLLHSKEEKVPTGKVSLNKYK